MQQKLIKYLCLILVAGGIVSLQAQTVNISNFYNYKNTTGLLYSQMNEVVQGADGAIHFISMEGATRYDGIHFTRRTTPYFSEGEIASQMKLTPSGKVMGLFGSQFIFVLDTWNKLKFATPEDAPKQISAYEFLSDEEVYLATEDGLCLARYYSSSDSFEIRFCLQKSLDYNKIISLRRVGKSNKVFGIDRNKGMFFVDENHAFIALDFRFGQKVKQFYDFALTEDNLFVLYNQDRMDIFDLRSKNRIDTFFFGKDQYFSRIEAIDHQSVWIASPYSGLIKYRLKNNKQGSKHRRYTVNNGLASNNVYDIFRDNQGVYWFATNDGVSKLASERFEKIILSKDAGLNGFPTSWQNFNGQTYTFSDPFGVGKLIRKNNGLVIESVSRQGTENIAFYSHYYNKKDRVLWLFSDNGVFYQYPAFSNSNIQKYREKNFISDKAVWQAYALGDRRILLGREKDIVLAEMRGKELNYINHIDIPGDGGEVSAFYPYSGEKDILVGGDRFIIRVKVDPKLTIVADLKHWFDNPDFFVYDIERDKNGTWFFGTANDGLIIRDHGRAFRHQNDKTVPYNTLYDLFFDSSGDLWGGSYNGITRMRYEGEGKLISHHFGIYDLIPPMDVNYHSIFETPNGEIIYGIANGVGIYYPSKDTIKNIGGEIEISAMELNGKEISGADLMQIPPRFVDLKIDYYFPVYFNEQQIDYQYMIEPISKEWKTTLAPGQILISNLPSGEYNLNIRAIDPGGICKEASKTLVLNVKYPFWQQIWFIALITLIFSMTIIFLWRIRVRRLTNRQRDLEEVISQRTREISLKNTELAEKNKRLAEMQKNKDEFISIVAHDLKNPISAIVNLSRMIRTDYEKLPSELNEDAKVIESAATHMNNLVKNLLDINRIEANKLVTHMHPIHVLSEMDKILETYRLIAWPKNIELELQQEIAGDEQIFGDSDSFGQICGNILSNAIKFSKADSKVLLTLSSDKQSIQICIEDWGPGIPDQHLNDIFKKYYTRSGDKEQNKAGNGLGLTIVRKLIELHNAQIEVSNRKESSGAIFNLIFKRHYAMENASSS